MLAMTSNRTETTITARMRCLELADPERRDIRRIILDTYEETHSFGETARRLALTKGGLSKWVKALDGHLETEKRIVFGEGASGRGDR